MPHIFYSHFTVSLQIKVKDCLVHPGLKQEDKF